MKELSFLVFAILQLFPLIFGEKSEPLKDEFVSLMYMEVEGLDLAPVKGLRTAIKEGDKIYIDYHLSSLLYGLDFTVSIGFKYFIRECMIQGSWSLVRYYLSLKNDIFIESLFAVSSMEDMFSFWFEPVIQAASKRKSVQDIELFLDIMITKGLTSSKSMPNFEMLAVAMELEETCSSFLNSYIPVVSEISFNPFDYDKVNGKFDHHEKKIFFPLEDFVCSETHLLERFVRIYEKLGVFSAENSLGLGGLERLESWISETLISAIGSFSYDESNHEFMITTILFVLKKELPLSKLLLQLISGCSMNSLNFVVSIIGEKVISKVLEHFRHVEYGGSTLAKAVWAGSCPFTVYWLYTYWPTSDVDYFLTANIYRENFDLQRLENGPLREWPGGSTIAQLYQEDIALMMQEMIYEPTMTSEFLEFLEIPSIAHNFASFCKDGGTVAFKGRAFDKLFEQNIGAIYHIFGIINGTVGDVLNLGHRWSNLSESEFTSIMQYGIMETRPNPETLGRIKSLNPEFWNRNILPILSKLLASASSSSPASNNSATPVSLIYESIRVIFELEAVEDGIAGQILPLEEFLLLRLCLRDGHMECTLWNLEVAAFVDPKFDFLQDQLLKTQNDAINFANIGAWTLVLKWMWLRCKKLIPVGGNILIGETNEFSKFLIEEASRDVVFSVGIPGTVWKYKLKPIYSAVFIKKLEFLHSNLHSNLQSHLQFKNDLMTLILSITQLATEKDASFLYENLLLYHKMTPRFVIKDAWLEAKYVRDMRAIVDLVNLPNLNKRDLDWLLKVRALLANQHKFTLANHLVGGDFTRPYFGFTGKQFELFQRYSESCKHEKDGIFECFLTHLYPS